MFFICMLHNILRFQILMSLIQFTDAVIQDNQILTTKQLIP